MIPMIDLARQHQPIQQEIDAGLQEVMASGCFLFGPNAAAFEEEAAAYLQARHAISCGSGSSALLMSLLALGIGNGDEVITTPFTFFATAGAILHCGARPIFVDIDPDSYNLDPTQVKRKLTGRTRALLPVHLFGHPAPMPELMAIAEQRGLEVIEDCAQSFGARVGGRFTGSWGTTGCFSFFPSKNLGACGDGGMITTQDDGVAARLRQLCNHGSSRRHYHECLGFNSRLDEIQAVVLRTKLKHIEAYNAARRRVASRYTEALADLEGVVTPGADPDAFHVYNHYTIRVKQRDEVRRILGERGIACQVHYPHPLHHQPVLKELCRGQRFPVAEKVAGHCLSLPMYPELTDAEIDEVAAALREAVRNRTVAV